MQRRKEGGLSQREVAERSGIGKSYISILELGESIPTVETIMRLAKGFNVKFSTLARQIETECDKEGLNFNEKENLH